MSRIEPTSPPQSVAAHQRVEVAVAIDVAEGGLGPVIGE
jgi:hypothetical protein